jgi:two-component system CheB/CheR fusion protein
MPDNADKPKKQAIAKAVASKKSISTRSGKTKSFPIVGIGGSAGSFIALEHFFTHMPADSGMAFVIIMHLDPNHKGSIADLIRNYTPMSVYEAMDGMTVEADNVYVIPPNKDMGIHNRKLLLLNIAKPKGYHQPIDYFLQSLADDQWNKAVAIILSGMGSDGETGVRILKEKLGMVMVQHPDTAQYTSMPLAAIATNQADYVLSPEEMPIKLIQYMNHPVLLEDPTEQSRSEIRNENSVQKILMLLRSHTGHDFSQYKKSTIIRRIDRRIAFHQLPDYQHYVNYLRENPQETDTLFNELLIGVTKFFRDSHAFDSLKLRLTNIIQQKKDNEPVRVWVAGCSTGEEAYSIAMMLIECVEGHGEKPPKLQVFATDLDAEAIEHARSGFYRSNIVADVSRERLDRFFVTTDNGYIVKKELREMIVFAQHNLIKDAPFTRLDLLCCRNVMIYLNAELQKKIIPIFHYSLHSKGIMFMGPAETIGGFTELFVPVDPKWKIFERKDGVVSFNKMIDFPFHVSRQPLNLLRMDENEKISSKSPVAEQYNKILLENFTPASVLVNDKGDIQYSNGRTGRFLELPSGEAVMNIHRMARKEIRYVLGNIIHQARTQKTIVAIDDIKLKEDNQVRMLNLKASLLEETNLQGLVLVIFEDKGILKKTNRKVKDNDSENKAMKELEKELVYTKQQLHSTIEQMETSLEELKSTNEELQSTNEELQSTNEESLTTKEEMQSLNEELMTINVQYQSKAEELARLNNDMKNLLDSTEIGTIFLDNDLSILRYTPQVRKLFNIIPADIGRPLSHVVPNFDYPMEEVIKKVIDRLHTTEIEVRTKTNEWYNVRIMPYRTMNNFISGAVLTFSIITGYKQMEFELQTLEKHTSDVISLLPYPAIQLNKDLIILNVNHSFLKMFGIEQQGIKGIAFDYFVSQQWKTDELNSFLKQVKSSETAVTTQFKPASGKLKTIEIQAVPFINKAVNQTSLILIILKEQ